MLFSTVQKLLIGEVQAVLHFRGYLVPFLYGGLTGMLLGQWYRRLKQQQIDLLHTYDETLSGWAKAIELRNKSTKDHSQRVTVLTEAIAREMNVSEEELVHIHRGALLHDIGKIAIPDAILSKEGPLTKAERKVIEEHPFRAYQMLEHIDFLEPALCIILNHHERWDGSGYPSGYQGEEIPFPARIIAVADVWDALTSDRPYRDAWSQEAALSYIEEGAGTLFDPNVVRVFSTYMRHRLRGTN